MRIRSVAIVVGPLALWALGCEAVLGVDFGGAHPRAESGAASVDDAGVAADEDVAASSTTPADPTGCKADEKTCNGVCVKKSDPLFGCGAASCTPCSVAYASKAKCDAAGACAVDTCVAGRADCNGRSDDGCEADLTSPATCTACTTACSGGTPLCTPTGCAASCPGSTTQCGSSCIDTQTSIAHCGQCNKKCAVVNNGSPSCASGNCGIACNPGYSDCNSNPLDGCEPLKQFFLDGDGDGVGGTTTQMACAPPAASWVAVGGDCHDGNRDVFPGQTAFFPTSYVNAGGLDSYDYNCDGAETEQGNPVKFVGGCGTLCENFGRLPGATRATPGADPYCGSTSQRTCTESGIPRLRSTPTPSLACTSHTLAVPALKCQ